MYITTGRSLTASASCVTIAQCRKDGEHVSRHLSVVDLDVLADKDRGEREHFKDERQPASLVLPGISSVRTGSGDPANISIRRRPSFPMRSECCCRIRVHLRVLEHSIVERLVAVQQLNLRVITVAILLAAVSLCNEALLTVTDARPLGPLERHGERDIPCRRVCRSTGSTAGCGCAEQVLQFDVGTHVAQIFTRSSVDVLITAT